MQGHYIAVLHTHGHTNDTGWRFPGPTNYIVWDCSSPAIDIVCGCSSPASWIDIIYLIN